MTLVQNNLSLSTEYPRFVDNIVVGVVYRRKPDALPWFWGGGELI